MPDSMAIANAVSKYFNQGSTPSASASTPSATPSPSGNGTADQAMDNFHKDLDQSICPDCHAAVKQVMNPSPQGSVSESTKPVPAQGGQTSVPSSKQDKAFSSIRNAFN